MRIYFSGGTGLDAVPESLAPERKPMIMLTFYDADKSGTKNRLDAFLKRKRKQNKKKSNASKP